MASATALSPPRTRRRVVSAKEAPAAASIAPPPPTLAERIGIRETFPTGKAAAQCAFNTIVALRENYFKIAPAIAAALTFPATRLLGGKSPTTVIVCDIDSTLIHGGVDGRSNPNIVHLIQQLSALHGVRIHLVTARQDRSDAIEFTRSQLAMLGLCPDGDSRDNDSCTHTYHGIWFAPREVRESAATVAAWKAATREEIARLEGAAVALTIGDQWGDSLVYDDVLPLVNEGREKPLTLADGLPAVVAALDAAMRAHGGGGRGPRYALLRVMAHDTLWGLKLPED